MSLFKKITRPIRKVVRKVRKIIPKEVKPFAPYIAAAFVPGAGAFGLNQGIARALVAGGTRGLIDEDADLGDIVRTGGIAALPNIIEGGVNKAIGTKVSNVPIKTFSPSTELSQLKQAPFGTLTTNPAGELLTETTKTFTGPFAKFADKLEPIGDAAAKLTGSGNLMAKTKAVGIGGSLDAIETSLGIQESLLDDQGIKDKSDRRVKLFEYLTGLENDDGSIVYTAEEANSL